MRTPFIHVGAVFLIELLIATARSVSNKLPQLKVTSYCFFSNQTAEDTNMIYFAIIDVVVFN